MQGTSDLDLPSVSDLNLDPRVTTHTTSWLAMHEATKHDNNSSTAIGKTH